MLYSGTIHVSSTLAIARDFLSGDVGRIFITDDRLIYERIERLFGVFFGRPITVIHHIGELLAREDEMSPILIHTDILREAGNIEEMRRKYTLSLHLGETIKQEIVIERLLALGYHHSDYAGEDGTYSRSGSIIRIWQGDREYVIEYFDDEIESIMIHRGDERKHIHTLTLAKRGKNETSTEITQINKELFPLFEKERGVAIGMEFSLERENIIAHFRDMIEFSSLSREGATHMRVERPRIETIEDFRDFMKKESTTTTLYTRYEKRVSAFLTDNGISVEIITTRELVESFRYDGHTVIGDDILGKIFLEDRVRKSTIRNLDLLLSIREGDYVVHREHGLGQYRGLTKKRIGLSEREYMEILYRNDARIYVPLTELSRITKYVGSEAELANLEGKEWERTLSKTEEEVEIIARDILETSAKRALEKGIRFGSFPEEETFRKAFPYEHTPDQRSIIEEVRSDMESDIAMDRLISGDVGFGKTEIAMNAIYKAVLSGMQVAVISPLLVLAEEHRETFDERLGAWGVRIASLTRMTTKKEEKDILEGMKSGTIDVVVGTHRLLSDDIRFRRLGLLIIDEEHRFGVEQKEAIKRMKAHIDILSLSATPIPRSLNMALSGLKKISLLTTPPKAKKPIETIISRWDEGLIASAIERELARGGQVIILHNRIASLGMVENDIREMMVHLQKKDPHEPSLSQGGTRNGKMEEILSSSGGGYLPENSKEILAPQGGQKKKHEPRIITLHGKLSGDEIEDRIHAFKRGEYDILISTTVIENGVNFLGANTMIISDAEEFGLAQLHQIRGRVGRRDIAGKCYLMYRKYELTSEERERLMILAEHSELGSGYEIAMRDLEMRGTGDILGFRQSGKTKEVGISLYFQLLEEKVDELKHGKKADERTKIELDLSYSIDDEYFHSELDKLSFFRDVDAIETLEDLEYAEATFRVESMPEAMENLFLTLRASIILRGYRVKKVSKIGNNYHFDFHEGTRPDDLRRFLDRYDSGHEFIIVSVTKIRVETANWRDVREFLGFVTK